MKQRQINQQMEHPANIETEDIIREIIRGLLFSPISIRNCLTIPTRKNSLIINQRSYSQERHDYQGESNQGER